ncbi:hypothetical protein ACHAXA_008224 [Cyclostephanos tholiformis]|uniref:Uncharacterized protein n=1 Tax=Cyclostephanos tholiformis TaxID=382380 RepID=A0ABD3R0S7_9STRA
MMESEYSPGVDATPLPPPPSSDDDLLFDDDPFRVDDLDLALALDDDGGGGVDSTAVPAAAPAVDDDDDVDPWAVLAAAAAGENASSSPPETSPTQSTSKEATILAHAEGEVFAMPGHDEAAAGVPPLLASITARIHEVDAMAGISSRVRTIDDQYHVTERLSHLKDDVIGPVVAGTIERTRDAIAPVKERVAPAVMERWGVVREGAANANIGERWSSISAAASSAAAGTAAQLSESVSRLRDELDVKRALANAASAEDDARRGMELPRWEHGIGGAKDKVVEGWTGGVNWLQRRILDARGRQMQNQQDYSGGGGGGAGGADPSLMRLDSYGLPSSFRRD